MELDVPSAAPSTAPTATRVVTIGNAPPALAGILYILVSLTAVYFEFNGPDVLDTPAEAAAGFVTERQEVTVAATLLLVASALFLVFLLGLSAIVHRIEAAHPARVPLAGFVLVTGTCAIVVLLVYAMIYGALATSIVGEAGPRTVLALLRVGNALDALASFFQAAAVLAASLILLRRPRVVPGWISWVGLASGLCACVATATFGTDGYLPALGAVGAVSLLLYVIWTIALNVDILLNVRRARPGRTPAINAPNERR